MNDETKGALNRIEQSINLLTIAVGLVGVALVVERKEKPKVRDTIVGLIDDVCGDDFDLGATEAQNIPARSRDAIDAYWRENR